MFDSFCVNYLPKLQLSEEVRIMQRINQKWEINDKFNKQNTADKKQLHTCSGDCKQMENMAGSEAGADATEGSRACSARKWVKAGEHPSL